MAKRRNKDKAKRRFAGLDRKIKINGDVNVKKLKKDEKTKLGLKTECYTADDPGVRVQVTESDILTETNTESCLLADSVKENNEDTMISVQQNIRKPRGRKPNKNKAKKQQKTEILPKPVYDTSPTDEVIICPTEIDGETCIDIKCGNNEAHMYLSKLCLGSKGACIKYCDSWLTPNEFQCVSGRETAKDWKRSIRHRGRSLKMFISKGLITVQTFTLKKSNDTKVAEAKLKEENPQTEAKKDVVDETEKEDENEMTVDAAKKSVADEKDAVGGNDVVVKPKITSDTKPIPKKRGRKPKKMRGRPALAKIKPLKEKKETTNIMETPLPEKVESIEQLRTDEVNKVADDTDKKSRTPDEKPEKTADEPADVPEDTRTEEERRLDEFVKSLKLTKAVAPKAVPDFPPCPNAKDSVDKTEEIDPEMPVLQKEADVIPRNSCISDDDQIDINVDIEPFHATVTPPPTPPGDKILIDRKTDDEKLIETFKSRLASPSNGLKLTINREKVKADNDEDCVNKTINDICSEQNNTKALLLQDALQSAKKYKEQLKQNSQMPGTKHISQIVNTKPVVSTTGDQTLPRSVPPTAFPKTSDTHRQHEHQKQVHNSTRRDHYGRPHNMSKPKMNHPHRSPPNGMPPIVGMENFGGGMSMPDFLAVMSSVYGPLPFPVNTKDAAFAALQEMHRRHDILRRLTQAQVSGSSPLLHPEHQLYNSYNIPSWFPPTKPSSEGVPKVRTPETQRRLTTQAFDTRPGWMSQPPGFKRDKDIPPPEIQHRRPSHSHDIQNSRVSQTQQETLPKKRKHSEPVNECALDLSIKKQKVEHTFSTAPKTVSGARCVEAPLDFSMRKTNNLDLCHNRSTENKTVSTNGFMEIHRTLNYSGNNSPTYSVPKSSPRMCSCDNERKDDITTWSVEHVCYFIRELDGCAPYAKTFHDQGISGKLLPYLTSQHLTKTLGMKVGPALTLIQAVERKFKERFMTSSSSPCQRCRIHLAV